MKSTSAEARAMSDELLAETQATLRRQIPRLQGLYDAVKREAKRRARQRKKAA